MYEAGVLQPWMDSAVVDAMLRLGKIFYLGAAQWTVEDCQENCWHKMD